MQPPADLCLGVSEFLAVCNQTLEYSYSGVILEGEIASFKINQNKWVFFDLKDSESSVACFMPLFQLRMPLTDGMRVRLKVLPKVTKWGKFSLTVQQIIPIGEGSIKKSFELLKAKLQKEGLFDPAKKRPLPLELAGIGVISSTQAAGYADFIKIINERWGGLKLTVAHTAVQGMGAADQIIRALQYFNEQGKVQVVAIIRGGGSADDLAVFNDENLVRAIAASRIPVVTGIGHEVDESLSDLAADLVGSTPSNVAQILTRDRQEVIESIKNDLDRLQRTLLARIDQVITSNRSTASHVDGLIMNQIQAASRRLQDKILLLDKLNPERVLSQGYAILTGDYAVGKTIKITTKKSYLTAEIKAIKERKP